VRQINFVVAGEAMAATRCRRRLAAITGVPPGKTEALPAKGIAARRKPPGCTEKAPGLTAAGLTTGPDACSSSRRRIHSAKEKT